MPRLPLRLATALMLILLTPIYAQTVGHDIEAVGLDGKTYVVSPGGDDNAAGDEANPLRTLQAAADKVEPGDTVLVRSGTYGGKGETIPLVIRHGGTADNWVRFAGYPGDDRPLIEFDAIRGIKVEGVSYVVVEGFELDGRSDEVDPDAALEHAESFEGEDHTQQEFFGVGIRIGTAEGQAVFPHHIILRDNVIHDTSGGGIASARGDYLLIEDNEVYRTSFYTPWGGSGISVWQNHNHDDRTDVYRVVIQNNLSYDNDNRVPFWILGDFSDGNGIIVDALRNTQEEIAKDGYDEPYNGYVLVRGNKLWNNGGRGVNIYESDRIDVTGNTLFKNGRRDNIENEIEFGRARDVAVVGNIIVPADGIRPFGGYQSADLFLSHNLIFGGETNPQFGRGENVVDMDPELTPPPELKPRADLPAMDAGLRRDADGKPGVRP